MEGSQPLFFTHHVASAERLAKIQLPAMSCFGGFAFLRILLILGMISCLHVGNSEAQVEMPMYGRPKYELEDGREWMFVLHNHDIDWYVETSKIERTDNGFKALIRSVKPTSINFGPLEVDCKAQLASVYYESWERIDLRLNNLVTRLFRDNCPPTTKE